MKRRALLFSMILIAASAWAQVVPADRIGGGSAAQLEGASEINLLTLGLGFNANYDDNPFLSAVTPQHQWLLGVSPNATWNMARKSWAWSADYGLDVSRDASRDLYDRTSHRLTTKLGIRATRRLSLVLRNSFIRSTDPFLPGFASAYNRGFDVTQQVNTSYLGTASVRTAEQVGVDATCRLSAHTSAGLGGTFALQRYDELAGVPQPQRDTNTVGANAFLSHQMSARRTIGVSYDFRKFTSPGGWSTISQRPSVYHTFTLSRSNSISLFAGPEYTSITLPLAPGITASLPGQWGWSVGGSFSWRGQRTGFELHAVRQSSDGGGLIGPVQMTSFGFSGTRKLGRRFTARVYGQYSINDSLQRVLSQQSGNYGSGGAALSWALARNFSAAVSYARREQSRRLLLNSNDWIDQNRITVAVHYQFSHPLGAH